MIRMVSADCRLRVPPQPPALRRREAQTRKLPRTNFAWTTAVLFSFGGRLKTSNGAGKSSRISGSLYSYPQTATERVGWMNQLKSCFGKPRSFTRDERTREPRLDREMKWRRATAL